MFFVFIKSIWKNTHMDKARAQLENIGPSYDNFNCLGNKFN